MILQSLNALYTRLAEDPAYEISPPGFSSQKISFRVVIKPDGSLFAIQTPATSPASTSKRAKASSPTSASNARSATSSL